MKIEHIICGLCQMDGEEARTAVAIYCDMIGQEWNVCHKHLELAKEAGLEYRMLALEEEVDEM